MLMTIFSGVISSIFPYKLGMLLDVVTKQTDNNVEPDKFKQILIDSMLYLTVVTVLIAVSNFFRMVSLKIYQEKLSIDMRN